MDTEDGVIWVYGMGDDGVMAFTDFGIENVIELSEYTRKTPKPSSGEIGGPLPRLSSDGYERSRRLCKQAK